MRREIKQCHFLPVVRRDGGRFRQILRHRVAEFHFAALDHVQQQQCGKSLRNRADLKNGIAVYFGRVVLELAGSENATAAFIDQSNDHVGIGEVLTEQRLDGFGLGIGETVLGRRQELGCQ